MSEKASLRELVDLNELQAIQDSFAKTVGTSSVILSPEGEQLTQFSNPTGFCALIQSTEEGKRRCFLSFMEMSQKALELEEPIIQYCFAHGGHFVAPIIIDGEHKGSMFAGQFIPQKLSAEQLKTIEKMAVEIHVDPNLLVEEAKEMRVVEEDAVRSYSRLLFQIVAIITRLGAQADELNRAKDALQKAHNGLEIRVQERTAELPEANKGLEQEVAERKQVEEALRESNAKIRSIAASAHDAVIMVDDEETISFWNEAAERIFGYTEDEMIGTKLHGAIIPERFREDALTGFKSFRETGQGAAVGKTVELAANRKDGTELPIELSLSAVKLKGKWNAIGLIRDISERKAAEDKIKESEERYKALFEFAMDGILIADIETREFYYANPAICRMLGYSVEELKGMGVTEIHPKDELEHVISEFEAQARGEKALALNIPCLRKDGTVIYADINTTRASIAGKDCNIGFFRDITERKEAEGAIKESEERFRTIFDRAVEGILLVDLDTRRFYMVNNAICQMLGYTVEELTNMGPADITPKEDLPGVMKMIEQAICEEISGGTSIPMQRKDGSVIHTNINGALIEFGGTKYLLGIIRDITELKKKTEALRRFNKLAVGRELRMIELKKEINALLEDLGKEPRYKIAGEGDEKN